eukprot:gene19666-26352_t
MPPKTRDAIANVKTVSSSFTYSKTLGMTNKPTPTINASYAIQAAHILIFAGLHCTCSIVVSYMSLVSFIQTMSAPTITTAAHATE